MSAQEWQAMCGVLMAEIERLKKVLPETFCAGARWSFSNYYRGNTRNLFFSELEAQSAFLEYKGDFSYVKSDGEDSDEVFGIRKVD